MEIIGFQIKKAGEKMIVHHALPDAPFDYAPYAARHSGDQISIYKSVQNELLCLSYYFPQGHDAAQKRPTILLIHGGGWSSRQIFPDQRAWAGDYLGYLARYFADRGYVAVSMDYRLMHEGGQTPQYQLPDLVADCRDALDYMVLRAARMGIDPENISVLGESAGGHLAGMLATDPNLPVPLRRAVLVNAICDFAFDPVWKSAVPQGSDAAALSPACRVTAAMCPTVLIHGENDRVVAPAQAERMYLALETHGVAADLHWIAQTDHAFLLAEYTDNLRACRVGIEILNSYFPAL